MPFSLAPELDSLCFANPSWFARLALGFSPDPHQERVLTAQNPRRALGFRPRGDGDNPHSLMLPNASRVLAVPAHDATTWGFFSLALLILEAALYRLRYAPHGFHAVGSRPKRWTSPMPPVRLLCL